MTNETTNQPTKIKDEIFNVNSKCLATAKFENEILIGTFHNLDTVYHYEATTKESKETLAGFASAESKGKYFLRHIRNNKAITTTKA